MSSEFFKKSDDSRIGNYLRFLTRILMGNLANKSDDSGILQDFDQNYFGIAAVANPVDCRIYFNSS